MTDPRAHILSSWNRAYCASMGEQPRAAVADKAARAAFIAAGGDPARAAEDVPRIIAAAISEHSDWLWRPAKERLAGEERQWKARIIWPPPLHARGGPESTQDTAFPFASPPACR